MARAAVLFPLAGDALAQAAATELPGVSSGAILQTVLGLGVILALLFALAFFVRKYSGGRGFGGHGPMRIVGGLMLGARERIVLIEIGDTWLLVGMTPGQMRTLHTMPKGELPAPTGHENPFGKLLKQMIDGKHEGS